MSPARSQFLAESHQSVYPLTARGIPPAHPPRPRLFRRRNRRGGTSCLVAGERTNRVITEEMDGQPRQVI